MIYQWSHNEYLFLKSLPPNWPVMFFTTSLTFVWQGLTHGAIWPSDDRQCPWSVKRVEKNIFYYHHYFCVAGTYAWRDLVVGNVHGVYMIYPQCDGLHRTGRGRQGGTGGLQERRNRAEMMCRQHRAENESHDQWRRTVWMWGITVGPKKVKLGDVINSQTVFLWSGIYFS